MYLFLRATVTRMCLCRDIPTCRLPCLPLSVCGLEALCRKALVDDMMFLQAAYKTCNRNPLGSAAGYGSSFPLDREMTTRLLGFDSMNYNVVYAQMGRGKVERNVSFALASIAGTLSKMAFDACMFSCQNFGFVKLPDECTTGSSIMPHKKNPDVFELTRAKCNKIQALPQQIMMIMNNLPSGYFRDLQIIKEVFLPAFEETGRLLADGYLHHGENQNQRTYSG